MAGDVQLGHDRSTEGRDAQPPQYGRAHRQRRHDLEPDPAALFAAFADGVTHAFLVPPVIAGIVGAGERAIAATSGLKYLGYGAAPMPLPLLHKALAAWPKMRFAQVYGQTEV